MKKRKAKLKSHKAIRRHFDRRMSLTIGDMPRYPGKIACLVGERCDHYPDGTHKARWGRDGRYV